MWPRVDAGQCNFSDVCSFGASSEEGICLVAVLGKANNDSQFETSCAMQIDYICEHGTAPHAPCRTLMEQRLAADFADLQGEG